MKCVKQSVNLGLFTNVIFAILKTIIGIYGKSQALIADGINSTSDVAYYLAVSIFMKKSDKPADKEHPYGHKQLDNIAAIVVGAFIITTGATIFWNSITTIYDMWSGTYSVSKKALFPLIVSLITILAKIFLYSDAKKTYKLSKNPTIKALMNDHINDLMASIGVFVSLLAMMINSSLLWVDPLASCLVAIFILRTGFEIIIDSSNELMDSLPDGDFASQIEKIVLSQNEVLSISHIGAHKYGTAYVLNITMEINPDLTVREGDKICDVIESQLMSRFNESLKKINIHYHPPK
jgi:cation diffusion facilitator family transporter